MNALLASWWDWSIKFVAPVILFFLISWGIKGEVTEPYGGGFYPAWALIAIGGGWLVVTHFAAVFFSHLKWRGRQV